MSITRGPSWIVFPSRLASSIAFSHSGTISWSLVHPIGCPALPSVSAASPSTIYALSVISPFSVNYDPTHQFSNQNKKTHPHDTNLLSIRQQIKKHLFQSPRITPHQCLPLHPKRLKFKNNRFLYQQNLRKLGDFGQKVGEVK